MGKIIVIGASPNPARFSYKAVKSLIKHDYEVVAIGFRKGKIGDQEIIKGMVSVEEVDKILLYLGAERQRSYYDYILRLKPKEILFNPGTENAELVQLAMENDIEVRYDCALVLLQSGLL